MPIQRAHATTIIDSPIGLLHLGATDNGLSDLDFIDAQPIDSDTTPVESLNPALPSHKHLLAAVQQLKEYFAGTRTSFDLSFDYPSGTPFQEQTWKALQTIPYGETWTYKELACAVGNERACRAVGSANNRNHLAIVIPCHRVIGSDGKLAGYAGELWRKQALLDLEAKHVSR